MSRIDVEDVYYAYKSKYQTVNALNGISCSFETGKFYAIEGRSGSGKTTLLSLLAGLDRPTGGEILLDGISYRTLDHDRLRREKISMIFQNYNLFPLLNAEENVMYPARLLGKTAKEARRTARELLESVGLGEPYFRRFPAMMSGGEQQRVAVARALASGAKLILADEPTGNLDTENAEKVVGILKNLVKEKGYGVILVTHDHSISEQSDVVYRIKDGKIV